MQERPDLRMPAVALVTWASVLAAIRFGPISLALAGVAGLVAWRRPRWRPTLLIWAAVSVAAVGCVVLRAEAIEGSRVARLATERATATAEVKVLSDPRLVQGQFGDRVFLRAELRQLVARGVSHGARAPVLISAPESWHAVRLGSSLRVAGRLAADDRHDLAAMFVVRGEPEVLAQPSWAFGAAERVRRGIREAVARHPVEPRALVPALVDGDDARMSAEVVEDFRTTGLTHLTAVSGTNLTLLIGALLIVARGLGVRARGLMVVGALGVVGFVLLARTEPSVLRAAVMGSVALVGMGMGRNVGTRALGVAATVLLLAQPWLADAPGFVLSVSATAGILWLAPDWRDRMCTWMPRWLAEAISVPLAAQIACTPMVAALSGEVSLVAVAANLLVAVVVGPVTVCGLLGGIVHCVWPWGGRLLADPAGWSARWIVAVAEWGSDLPVPALTIGTSATAITLVLVASVLGCLVLGPMLARRGVTLCSVAVLVLVVLVPAPRLGWPPHGWVMVMCDVGQGDGFVIRTGPAEALVVDVGPDPAAIDRCLDRLRITRLTAVVLTHFHADHIDGLPGALQGRRVGSVVVTPFATPEYGARAVHREAQRAGVPVLAAEPGAVSSRGGVQWQVLAPTRPPPVGSPSPPNDSSVVLLVRAHGLDILLMGDQEEMSQADLRRSFPDLRADVVKIAHHGSARQDWDLLRSLDARLALLSLGADNDYGHPAPSVRKVLAEEGLTVRRTDRDGDVAVMHRDGLRVQSSR